MHNMFTYTFKNGSVVNGTVEEILAVAAILKEPVEGLDKVPKGYYPSSSKGVVKISEMHTEHIKNAITKIAYNFYRDLGKKKDLPLRVYLRSFVLLAQEPYLNEMFTELEKRAKLEEDGS